MKLSLSDKILRARAIAHMFDGVWLPEHTEDTHYYRYTKDGKPTDILVPSVTQILQTLAKPHLVPWAAKMALEYFIAHLPDYQEFDDPDTRQQIFKSAQFAYTGIRDNAGNIGTQAHDAVEKYLKEWIKNNKSAEDIRTVVPPGSDPRVFAAVRSAESIMRERKLVPIASEILVGSPKIKCAGTLDALVMDEDGKLLLTDFKTSNSVDPIGYALQVSAYAKFFEEMTRRNHTPLRIAKVQIFHLSKDFAKCDVWDIPAPHKAYQAFQSLLKVREWMNDPSSKAYKKINKIIL